MAVATEHYEGNGWSVTDTSASKPYDLVCTKGGAKDELRVEVKGTTSSGTEVELTAGEVANAETHPHVALLIVSAIKLTGSDESAKATGGEAKIIDPWAIDEGDLKSIRFRYSVPAG